VVKQCSARGATAKRKLPGKVATGTRKKQTGIGNAMGHGDPQRQEDVARHTELTRELVLQAWPEIVRGLIKKAASGGYQQAKLLLDLYEIADKHDSQSNEQHRRQLCDALLEGLGLPATQEPTAEAGAQVEPETIEAL